MQENSNGKVNLDFIGNYNIMISESNNAQEVSLMDMNIKDLTEDLLSLL